MRAPSLADARARLDSGDVSAVELVGAALTRAQACAQLGAVVGVRPGAARKEAKAADARRREGRLRSRLDGIPLVLKDNMVKRGEPFSGFLQNVAGIVVRVINARSIVVGNVGQASHLIVLIGFCGRHARRKNESYYERDVG